MEKILAIHGPNLNLLGQRETHIYGNISLDELNHKLKQLASKLGYSLECCQSNAEHEIVEAIHQAKTNKTDAILINPAAFTHTSIAIRDAFLAVDIPFIEVHLSNIYTREPFRHQSYLSDIALGGIFGFGPFSYELALNALDNYLKKKIKDC